MSTEPGRGAQPAAPNINVTPFIDILLVLLIIFMVVTPLRPARFRALVPEPPPESDAVRKSPRTLVVSVEMGGRLRLVLGREVVAEGTVADSGEVTARLAREFAECRRLGVMSPELERRTDLTAEQKLLKTVFIKAPRALTYGEVARVIDHVKGAGASPVGLQTDALDE